MTKDTHFTKLVQESHKTKSKGNTNQNHSEMPTPCLLRWLYLFKIKIESDNEIVEKPEPLYIAGKAIKRYINCMMSASKAKQLGPSSSTPWYTPERTENIGSNKKHVHECYSKTIHQQKVEAIQNVHQHETDKCNMVHLCRGILFSLKKNEVVVHATTWINLENTVLST